MVWSSFTLTHRPLASSAVYLPLFGEKDQEEDPNSGALWSRENTNSTKIQSTKQDFRGHRNSDPEVTMNFRILGRHWSQFDVFIWGSRPHLSRSKGSRKPQMMPKLHNHCVSPRISHWSLPSGSILPAPGKCKPQVFNLSGGTGYPDRVNMWAVMCVFSQQPLQLKKLSFKIGISSCLRENGICLRFLDEVWIPKSLTCVEIFTFKSMSSEYRTFCHFWPGGKFDLKLLTLKAISLYILISTVSILINFIHHFSVQS